MKPLAASPVRIARPSHDLRAAERFWVDGLGLVDDPEDATPAAPTEEDLLVLYLGGEVDEDLVRRLVDGLPRGGPAYPGRCSRAYAFSRSSSSS